MTELNTLLQQYTDRDVAFEDLVTNVEALAQADIANTVELLSSLGDARATEVLSEEEHRLLQAKVVGADRMNVTAAFDVDDMEKTQRFSAESDTEAAAVGPGSVIKGRFLLEEKIGSGGMGVVYRARDRIRVEANDRNPNIAIKVLNEDFKVHPESLIALQRECSKAQRLAHPNIATVYDFDRTGGMAYMTMELLEGKPLNEYFASDLPDAGLPVEKAWPMIRDMAAALGYAHKNHIVHSDFKPSNAFICSNGVVQVLDFGIARAVKPPGQADTTHFDAGSLNALTPTYASAEMLEGDPPDPRDDLYGLGVVAYILLASAHPFERHPANMAKALDLQPKPIASLNKAQNSALRRLLSFEREERTPDVETFIAEFEGAGEAGEKLHHQGRLIAILSVGFLSMLACVVYLLMR